MQTVMANDDDREATRALDASEQRPTEDMAGLARKRLARDSRCGPAKAAPNRTKSSWKHDCTAGGVKNSEVKDLVMTLVFVGDPILPDDEDA